MKTQSRRARAMASSCAIGLVATVTAGTVVLSSTAAVAAPAHRAATKAVSAITIGPISIDLTPNGPPLAICLTLAPVLPTTCIPL